MDLVPIQELTVARYSTKVTRIEDIDEQAIKGCLTKSSKIGDGKKTPWDLRVFPIHVEEVNYAFPSILVASENFRTVSCINGIALLKTDDKIETVGGLARPRVLYRAIHSGQPDGGIKSRLGRGSDAVFFHHHLRRHLRWQSREPSPFLSATTSLDKAILIAAIYMAKN